MRQYELMVILDPELDDRTVQPSLDKFLTVITKDGGTVDNIDIWGRRRLAYEIRKKAEGIYAVVNFTSEPATARSWSVSSGSTSRSCGRSSFVPRLTPPSVTLTAPTRTLNRPHRTRPKGSDPWQARPSSRSSGTSPGTPSCASPLGRCRRELHRGLHAAHVRQGQQRVEGRRDAVHALLVWRDAAENVAESLARGPRVIVTARLKSRSYETKEGEKRTVIELDVDEVGPSMKYATAKVNKTSRGGGGGGFGGDSGGGQQDPWATGGSAPSGGASQGGQGGGWNQPAGGQSPSAQPQGGQQQGGQQQGGQQGAQGGWGNAPAYDEPPF